MYKLLLLVMMPIFSFAQSSVQGKITDKENNPIHAHVAGYSYRIFLENGRIFLQNAGFFCKFIETRQKILRYIRSDVAYVGPRPILS